MKRDECFFCNRRKFLSLAAIATGSLVFGSCTAETKNTENKATKPSNSEKGIRKPNEIEVNQKMPRESVKKILDQRVNTTMAKAHHCAQTAFIALSEQFGLGGKDIIKALTPLPGIAERGETCGAITGSLMAMGLVFGRDRLDNFEAYRKSLVPTGAFCDRFEKRLGSLKCREIVDIAFGREFDLRDPEDLKDFQRAGATEKCSAVVREAVRIAADIILDNA